MMITKAIALALCAGALSSASVGAIDSPAASAAAPASRCPPNPAPTAAGDLPPRLRPYAVDRQFVGEGVLWTVLPRPIVHDPATGTWTLRKQAWFRLTEGQLTVDGRRRHGGTGTFRAHIPRMESYPLDLNLHVGPGFIPSSFEFSRAGCWKLTARLGTSKVVLHVDIDDPTS